MIIQLVGEMVILGQCLVCEQEHYHTFMWGHAHHGNYIVTAGNEYVNMLYHVDTVVGEYCGLKTWQHTSMTL